MLMSRPGPVGRGRAGWHQRQLGAVPAERHVTPRGGVLPRPVTARDGRLVRELKPDGSLLSGLSIGRFGVGYLESCKKGLVCDT